MFYIKVRLRWNWPIRGCSPADQGMTAGGSSWFPSRAPGIEWQLGCAKSFLIMNPRPSPRRCDASSLGYWFVLAKADEPTRTRVTNLYWLRLSVFLISFTSSIVSTLRSGDQASLWKMMMTEFLGIAMNCSDRYILAPAPHRTRSMLLNT